VAATTTAGITSYNRGGGTSGPTAWSISSARARCSATVERLEYDPNRTAFIALVKYEDGDLSYILAPQRLNQGDTVVSG
jgi:large subunit ribosomal protein L2